MVGDAFHKQQMYIVDQMFMKVPWDFGFTFRISKSWLCLHRSYAVTTVMQIVCSKLNIAIWLYSPLIELIANYVLRADVDFAQFVLDWGQM